MSNMAHIFGTAPGWDGSTLQYRKHDIVTYNSQIYYSLSDHISSPSEFPSNSSTIWGGRVIYFRKIEKPSFVWKPSYNSRTNNEPRIREIKFGDGYEQRSSDGINSNLLNFNYVFDKRDEDETLAICHFLDQRGGKESFVFTPPKPYGLAKLFKCRTWEEGYDFYDNHVINANFVEVPE